MAIETTISADNLENLKRAARYYLPRVKNMHRLEALARGIGFNTYAALLSALDGGQAMAICRVKEAAFTAYLSDKGFAGLPSGTLGAILVMGARRAFESLISPPQNP